MVKARKRVVRQSVRFLEISNLTYTGKQVIVYSSGEWKHLWIDGKSTRTILKPYQPSSSMVELVRRKQIGLREIVK